MGRSNIAVPSIYKEVHVLGSIQRGELVSTISELIGKERRHQVCMERYGFKLKQMQLREQKEMEQRIEDKIQQKADERIQQVCSFLLFQTHGHGHSFKRCRKFQW